MSKTGRKTCEHWETHIVPDFEKNFVQCVQNSKRNAEFCDLIITDEAKNIKYIEIYINFFKMTDINNN